MHWLQLEINQTSSRTRNTLHENQPMNQAPWPDYAGNPIHEGDVIVHPSGESGKVTFLEEYTKPSDQWRVDYGTPHVSRLCLQIGDKGMAVVRPVPFC